MLSLGIDLGYSAVKIAILDATGRIRHCAYARHKGRIAQTLRALLEVGARHCGAQDVALGAVTGSGAALLAGVGLPQTVNEVAALVEGGVRLVPQAGAIVEIGGQTAKYATGFTATEKSRVEVSINSNCASGTGAFLEDQVARLGLSIEDFSTRARQGASVPRIAGRCSVFAKTDITHHQQEGVPVADILRGLAHAVVRNYRGAVMRKLPVRLPILFAGGVSRNEAIIEAFRAILGLPAQEFVTHEHAAMAVAVGAALLARERGLAIALPALFAATDAPCMPASFDQDSSDLPPLAGFGRDDAAGKHDLPGRGGFPDSPVCFLGIDVGSTSTNLVLTDTANRIMAYQYLRTAGDPVGAVRAGLGALARTVGRAVTVAGVAVTGSGRSLIGRLVGADVVRDEITAQARAAVAIDPAVDTIFEIGGQDSKFISLTDGVITDFQMNKVCAAGTGSFLEEQAAKLGISLEDFGPMALAAPGPVPLGERCTVFMETAVAARLARGASRPDIAAGLCYSIVQNYLNRVVGQRRVGQKIFLQGGLGHNQGVVNAFRAVTGAHITVPPFFSVTGAYGAAILAREEMTSRPARTRFRGFDLKENPDTAVVAACESNAGSQARFDRRLGELLFAGCDDAPDPAQKTVGIPRALFGFGMYPMFAPFFKELGLNVLLSRPTSEETVRLAQEYALDETCYPVKLVNGHVADLIARKVDYVFFPDLFTVRHESSRARRNYGCAYMQIAFRLVRQAMDLKGRGIGLLAPTIAHSLGPQFMRDSFMQIGRQLGASDQAAGLALARAMESYRAFEVRRGEHARETLASLDAGKKTFVLVSKIYGVADQALHMGIPGRLMDMGYAVIPFAYLPKTDIFAQHPNMYWPFGQHILEAARLVKRHPGLYAIFLTHHGCGPDTVLSHYFREIMGEKPYLAVEVDEHASNVGVATRVEAFVRSLERTAPRSDGRIGAVDVPDEPTPPLVARLSLLAPETTVYLPHMPPYADLIRERLAAEGRDARLLRPTSRASVDMGRRHTVTNEYYSMAALLGDVLASLGQNGAAGGKRAVVVPQNEGAEVDGQYARFLRAKLDAAGLGDVAVVSPFLEDLAEATDADVRMLFLCLLFGDVVLAAPRTDRARVLAQATRLLREGRESAETLAALARSVRHGVPSGNGSKTLFALGEPLVLYNDALCDDTLGRLEDAGHRVLRAPLAECLWLLWSDHLEAAKPDGAACLCRRLDDLAALIAMVSGSLGECSPYAPDLASLRRAADAAIGRYAGAFGRYRAARTLTPPATADGCLAVASMYENTGISLGILMRERSPETAIPLLQLTFDGTRNAHDRAKVDAFLYYLGERRPSAPGRCGETPRSGQAVAGSDGHGSGCGEG
ncbi:MAG TPA: acyl-CoA dehydratase activase [Solidesulfovibrio sp.]|nr:acyl-CoA dehydratase activase [Solidesulfovibrio sp.]